jgi:two-component system phosphate regulon response regulator PhoB
MSNTEKILVVDDEEDILELVKFNLAKANYEVLCAATGEEALKITRSSPPALLVLDLMLPGINGLEICKKLKSSNQTRSIPIIMLTAKGEEADVVAGLEAGADDYVTKPFSPKVLVARVRANLRRLDTQPKSNDMIQILDLTIDPTRFEVSVKGKKVDLTYTEFKTLHTLARRPGRVFTRYQIVDAIRGENYAVTDRAVDVQIVSLRKKLGSFGKYIETVRGVGYRFKDL